VFQVPGAPPTVAGLKVVSEKVVGPTAKIAFYGKIDFGGGAKNLDNMMLVSFVNERGQWKYDGAEFINLGLLPEVKKQLAAGDYSYCKEKDFMPTGKIKAPPTAIRGPVKYITKVYAFCPGREITTLINKKSRHTFQNTKKAEVVIGGAFDGQNEIQFLVKDIPGGNPKDPMTLRVYLFSQIDQVKPVKVFEYQVEEGKKPVSSATKYFKVGPQEVNALRGAQRKAP